MKPHICWLTPDYLLDTDFNLVPQLLDDYLISWIIVLPAKNARFKESDFQHLRQIENLNIHFFYIKFRQRDLRLIFFFKKLFSFIKGLDANLVFINYVVTLYFLPFSVYYLSRKNTILTAHQGEVHKGFRFQKIFASLYKIAYTYFNKNQLYSKSQTALFKKHYPNNNVFTIPLSVKDFGGRDLDVKKDDKVTFLSFGSIRPQKRIDLLIKATNLLVEQGINNFKVIIAGHSDNWKEYECLIKYKEFIECDIRSIENSEIPFLFKKAHYLVLPYEIVTQSGPMKIAYNYNLPIISSNLKGFTDEMEVGDNGFVFEPNNYEDLASVMKDRIEKNTSDYGKIQHSLSHYVAENYSDTVIIDNYKKMFGSILNTN